MAKPGPILVVDDDLDIRDTLAQVLELEGFTVVCAKNGHDALCVLADRSLPKPTVIVLDLMMPVMNGIEFRERQMADSEISSIPVIVLSADGRMLNRAQSAGIQHVLRKPIELEELIREIRRFF